MPPKPHRAAQSHPASQPALLTLRLRLCLLGLLVLYLAQKKVDTQGQVGQRHVRPVVHHERVLAGLVLGLVDVCQAPIQAGSHEATEGPGDRYEDSRVRDLASRGPESSLPPVGLVSAQRKLSPMCRKALETPLGSRLPSTAH